jgi:hypothetical protein
MPLFDYKCPICGAIKKDVFIDRTYMKQGVPDIKVMCEDSCGTVMQRMVSLVHTKVGTSVDSRDPGKVTREKNEKLKKRESGYKHEERNLREDIKRKTQERLSK